MISKALQTELFRIKIDSLGKKIPKFPEFNLAIDFMIAPHEHDNVSKLLRMNTVQGKSFDS